MGLTRTGNQPTQMDWKTKLGRPVFPALGFAELRTEHPTSRMGKDGGLDLRP